jgi:predicted O-linked N-acetylglucosamine transferase (SPINDLY family)
MAYFVYIGTVGSPTVDYIITDRVASPPSSSIGHTEKFLYLPTSFFPNNHAVHFPAPSYGSRGQNSVALRTQLGLPQVIALLNLQRPYLNPTGFPLNSF